MFSPGSAPLCTCLYSQDQRSDFDEKSTVQEFTNHKTKIWKKLIKDISVLKADSEVKIINLVKAQMAEVDEV